MPRDPVFDKLVEDSAAKMGVTFDVLASELTRKIEGAIIDKMTLAKKNNVMNQVDTILQGARERVNADLLVIIPDSYQTGIAKANKLLPKRLASKALSAQHVEQINALLDTASTSFGIGLEGTKKAAGQMLNKVYKAQISETIAEGTIGGASLDKTRNEVLKQLQNQGFTTFVRKDGVAMNLKAYAEMLTRTETINSANNGTVNRGKELGVTIYEFSDHANECPLCRPYEGQVYDITGKEYPEPPDFFPNIIHPNSFHKDTEVLTPKGWRYIKDMKKGETVISMHPETREWEEVKIKELVNHKQDKLIHIYNKWFDLKVTPDHDMAVEGNDKVRFVKAKDFNTQNIPRTVNWIKDRYDSNLYLFMFMAAYLSDGYVYKGAINIVQEDKRGREILKEILDFLHWPYTLNKKGFYIKKSAEVYRSPLHDIIVSLGKCNQKYIPKFIKLGTKNEIRSFLNTYKYFDGHQRKKAKKYKDGNFKKEVVYFTTSKQLADDIGELVLKVGNRPSYSIQKPKTVKHHNGIYTSNYDLWVIRECRTKMACGSNLKKEVIDYNDIVYCVELEKYHLLYVRYNGKCTWCGNCRHSWLPRPALQKEFK